jgi:hypothetical protein
MVVSAALGRVLMVLQGSRAEHGGQTRAERYDHYCVANWRVHRFDSPALL